jgi:hypothetical protein
MGRLQPGLRIGHLRVGKMITWTPVEVTWNRGPRADYYWSDEWSDRPDPKTGKCWNRQKQYVEKDGKKVVVYCPGCLEHHQPHADHTLVPEHKLWHGSCLQKLRSDLRYWASKRQVRLAVAPYPDRAEYYWVSDALIDDLPPLGTWRRNENRVVGYWDDDPDMTFVPRACYHCAHFRGGSLYTSSNRYRYAPACNLGVKLPTRRGNCKRRWGPLLGGLIPQNGGLVEINGIPVRPDTAVPDGFVRATFKDGSTRLLTVEQARQLQSGKYKFYSAIDKTGGEKTVVRRVDRRPPTVQQQIRRRKKLARQKSKGGHR